MHYADFAEDEVIGYSIAFATRFADHLIFRVRLYWPPFVNMRQANGRLLVKKWANQQRLVSSCKLSVVDGADVCQACEQYAREHFSNR